MNKYDVMFEETKSSYAELLGFYIKAFFYRRRLKKGEFKGNQAEIECARLYDNIFPYIINMAHLGYENYKDFEEINSNERADYFKRNHVSPLMFHGEYYTNINRYIRLLLCLAIYNTEGIEFDLNSRNLILKLMNDGKLEICDSYIVELYDRLSEDNKVIFSKILHNHFSFRDLTVVEMELLNNYHESFMGRNIYPRVTTTDGSKERILKESILFVKRG